jgi:hypothetical protein
MNTTSPLNDLPKMTTYTEQSHPNLYNEIIKDINYRWGKFSPIPYPLMKDKDKD